MLTYTTVIAIALDSAASKCLPLREIYAFFEAHGDSIPLVQRPNWKNSVRHTLSGHACFQKVPPPPGAKASRTWTLLEPKLPRCSVRPLRAYREVMGRPADGSDRFGQAMDEAARLEGAASAEPAPLRAAPALLQRNHQAAPALLQRNHQAAPAYLHHHQPLHAAALGHDDDGVMANMLLAQRMKQQQQHILLQQQQQQQQQQALLGVDTQQQQQQQQQQQSIAQLLAALQPDALQLLLQQMTSYMPEGGSDAVATAASPATASRGPNEASPATLSTSGTPTAPLDQARAPPTVAAPAHGGADPLACSASDEELAAIMNAAAAGGAGYDHHHAFGGGLGDDAVDFGNLLAFHGFQ